MGTKLNWRVDAEEAILMNGCPQKRIHIKKKLEFGEYPAGWLLESMADSSFGVVPLQSQGQSKACFLVAVTKQREEEDLESSYIYIYI